MDGLPGGGAAEEDAGPDHRGHGEEQDGDAQAHVHLGGQGVGGHHRQDRAHDGDGQAEPEEAAQERQHHALREELGRDLTRRGAQGRPERHLALPCRAPGQEQVRHVGAGDQEHQADPGEQEPEGVDRVPGEEVVLQRLDADLPALLLVGEGVGDAFGNALHLRVRLCHRDAGFEPAHDQQPVEVVVDLVRSEGERQVHLLLDAVARPRPQHADHGVRLAVEPDRLAHDRGIGAPALLPEAVRQDDALVVADDAFLRDEIAPELELVAEVGDPTRSGGRREDLLGPLVADGEAHGATRPGVQALERRALRAPVDEVPGGDGVPAVRPRLRPDHDQLVGVVIRHGLEEGAVHHAEYRGVGSDPEPQGEHGDGGEAGVPGQEPETIPDVPNQCAHGHLAGRQTNAAR